MTNRMHLSVVEADFARHFDLPQSALEGVFPMPPRYNIAPTQPVLTLCAPNGRRQLRFMRWGFVPDWVKDPAEFAQIHTARSESVEKKVSFKNAIRYRRCLVPVTGYYQWRGGAEAHSKQPYFFFNANSALFALAGIWETWMGPYGEEVDTLAILTRKATKRNAQANERQPVIISPDEYHQWMDISSGLFHDARALLRKEPDVELEFKPVSRLVNNPEIDSPDVCEPVEPDVRTEQPSILAAQKSPSQNKPASNDDDQLKLF